MPYIKISFDCLSCGEVDCKCPDKKHDLECPFFLSVLVGSVKADITDMFKRKSIVTSGRMWLKNE